MSERLKMSEVDLCDQIRDWAERLGFDVYPEVAGWDLVLVADKPLSFRSLQTSRRFEDPAPDVLPGDQVGIHAKLRPNCDVLLQACPWNPDAPGPRLPFVAVPRAGSGFCGVAHRLGLGVMETDPFGRFKFEARSEVKISEFPRRRPDDVKQLTLPPIASRAIAAGAPSPRVLGEWRVKALRFLTFARDRDTFTCTDLVGFGLSKSWVERFGEPEGWTEETRRGKVVRVRTYKLTAKAERLPDWRYGDVYAEMLAAEAKDVA
jgi:hypothetical protein